MILLFVSTRKNTLNRRPTFARRQCRKADPIVFSLENQAFEMFKLAVCPEQIPVGHYIILQIGGHPYPKIFN